MSPASHVASHVNGLLRLRFLRFFVVHSAVTGRHIFRVQDKITSRSSLFVFISFSCFFLSFLTAPWAIRYSVAATDYFEDYVIPRLSSRSPGTTSIRNLHFVYPVNTLSPSASFIPSCYLPFHST